MKKWLVLAAVLLLAIAGGVRFLWDKDSGRAGFPSAQLPVEVSLPGGATQYYIPAEFSSVPSRSGAPSTYGALPTIKNKIYDSGPCEGGSLNAIFSAHGRIWGYQAPYGSFLSADNEDTYDLLGRYLSCAGLARGTPSFCDYLPGEGGSEKLKVDLPSSPNYKCREYYRKAAEAGSAGDCPEDYRGLCSAFLSRTEESCSAILAKLGASYCVYLAKAQKRAGGYAGFSPEELKAEFERQEEEKAAAEEQRQEKERATEEINKRVRKLMGKQ